MSRVWRRTRLDDPRRRRARDRPGHGLGGRSRRSPDLMPATTTEKAPQHVLRNPGVIGIGIGSLLSDAGHEMATAALPGFLRSIGAPAAALGAIEGVADATQSAAKLAGGFIADKPGVERRGVTASGYAVTALGHGAFALANAWPVVAVARGVSWF